jgi:prephenate dehydratase
MGRYFVLPHFQSAKAISLLPPMETHSRMRIIVIVNNQIASSRKSNFNSSSIVHSHPMILQGCSNFLEMFISLACCIYVVLSRRTRKSHKQRQAAKYPATNDEKHAVVYNKIAISTLINVCLRGRVG